MLPSPSIDNANANAICCKSYSGSVLPAQRGTLQKKRQLML